MMVLEDLMMHVNTEGIQVILTTSGGYIVFIEPHLYT